MVLCDDPLPFLGRGYHERFLNFAQQNSNSDQNEETGLDITQSMDWLFIRCVFSYS